MSFSEVKELRKSGNLDQALLKANEDLEVNPEDIWNKRSIAWVYYDYLKQNADPEKADVFIEYLQKLKDLNLPADENMVFDNVAFQVGKLVFALNKKDHFDNRVDQIFNLIKDMPFSKNSDSYSFLYKAFHKGYKNWHRYHEFAEWWDFSNFQPADYQSEEYKGKKMMTLVEQAHIAYSKALLEGTDTNELGYKVIDHEKIQAFIPKLDDLMDKHPEYKYPPFFKAKLLLKSGDKENVLSAFLPFAKSKRNDFWVWDLMADVFEEEDSRKLACLCKALSLPTPEDFLINTRQKMAGLLIKNEYYNEAKTEIEKIIATREGNEWKLPAQIQQWTEQDWYQSAAALENNQEFYKQHVKEAEELLFADVPEELIVVEFVNQNKKILNFVKDKETSGFFKYDGFIQSPQIGDLLKVRFNGEPRDQFYKVLSIEKANSDAVSPAVKEFEGRIKILDNLNIGFVEDVFIEPRIIEDNQLEQGQKISGKAILSYNKKKEEWGWKAVNVND